MSQEKKSPIFDPAHVFYGFGEMETGSSVQISAVDALQTKDSLSSIQQKVHSHAAHTGKKYRTKRAGDVLHVERLK